MPDFQQRLTVDIGTRKVGGGKRERCGSLVGCVLAWVTEAVHPLSPPPLLPPSHPFSTHAFGFRGNITRKWWLACECRYHFLARYQPALPVITAPPGLRHGLLDKPPTAKVYCVFHVPSPSIYASPSPRRVSYSRLVLSGSLTAFLHSRLSPSLYLPYAFIILSRFLFLYGATPSPTENAPSPPLPRRSMPDSSHFRHSEMYRIVWESPEAPRDYLGKRICRSLPRPISPKRASSKRTSSMAGPGPIDSHPRAGAPPGSPYPANLRRTPGVLAVSVFLGLWRQSCRAAPDGLSESPLLIWPRDPEMCNGSFPPLLAFGQATIESRLILPSCFYIAWICTYVVSAVLSLNISWKNTSLLQDAVKSKERKFYKFALFFFFFRK